MKNFTLCFLLHFFGKNQLLCKCPFNTNQPKKETPTPQIQITYVNQKGKGNIAGDGYVNFKSNHAYQPDIEHLKVENKRLTELIELLRKHDK